MTRMLANLITYTFFNSFSWKAVPAVKFNIANNQEWPKYGRIKKELDECSDFGCITHFAHSPIGLVANELYGK